jgi:hypothetical protein
MENLTVSEFSPNPTKAYSRITVNAVKSAEVKFYMFTLEGKGLLSALYQLDKGVNEFSFDFSSLEPGIYYGLFDTPEGQALRKLVKIK